MTLENINRGYTIMNKPAAKKEIKKVVLAYSGGLDTSSLKANSFSDFSSRITLN